MRGVVTLCETPEQAQAALAYHPHAAIVALGPLVDAWRERAGRDDPTVEDLVDDRALNRKGTDVIERVEAIAAAIDSLFARRTAGLACAPYLSFRGYFHYLNSIIDSFVLRSEQIAGVLDALKPERVIVFRVSDRQFCGLTSLDRPAWGLTSLLLPHHARLAGIPVDVLDAPSVDPSLFNPTRDVGAALLPAAPGQLGRLSNEVLERTKRLFRSRATPPTTPGAQVSPARDGPVLINSLFSDVIGAVYDVWKERGGTILNLGEAFPSAPGLDDRPYRPIGAALFGDVENDRDIQNLLTWRGVPFWPWLRDWFHRVLTVRYPQLLEWAERLRRAMLVERRFGENAVILAGGWVEDHHVMARVAAAAKIPTVSYHYSGFLGFSLLPKHERYDFAECDHFIAGGRGAAETFAQPAPQTRWNPEVKRACPIPTGLGWLERRVPGAAPAERGCTRRIMVVLNALLGDCRDLGYVFYPEIAYWRFKRRIIARLAREPDVEILIKPPLVARYPQMPNPLLDWLAENGYANVEVMPDRPLAECLDEADAFILESPSTPLLVTVATDKPVAVYIDRSLYLFQQRAWDALSRRTMLLADTEDAFMQGLDDLLNTKATWQAPSDRTFLNDYADGGEGSPTRRICDFLLSLTADGSPSLTACVLPSNEPCRLCHSSAMR